MSHYPDAELNQSLPYPNIMSSAWLGNDKYKVLSHRFDSPSVQTRAFEAHDLSKQEMDAQAIRPSRLVWEYLVVSG